MTRCDNDVDDKTILIRVRSAFFFFFQILRFSFIAGNNLNPKLLNIHCIDKKKYKQKYIEKKGSTSLKKKEGNEWRQRWAMPPWPHVSIFDG